MKKLREAPKIGTSRFLRQQNVNIILLISLLEILNLIKLHHIVLDYF